MVSKVTSHLHPILLVHAAVSAIRSCSVYLFNNDYDRNLNIASDLCHDHHNSVLYVDVMKERHVVSHVVCKNDVIGDNCATNEKMKKIDDCLENDDKENSKPPYENGVLTIGFLGKCLLSKKFASTSKK